MVAQPDVSVDADHRTVHVLSVCYRVLPRNAGKRRIFEIALMRPFEVTYGRPSYDPKNTSYFDEHTK